MEMGCVYPAKCGSRNWYPISKQPCWFYWMSVTLSVTQFSRALVNIIMSFLHFHSTVLYALSQVPFCMHFQSTVLYALSKVLSCTHFYSTILYALSPYLSVRTYTYALHNIRLLSDMQLFHLLTRSEQLHTLPLIRCKDTANCSAVFSATSTLFPLQCLLMWRHKFYKHAPSQLWLCLWYLSSPKIHATW